MAGVLGLLTDFGLSDGYVGVMKAVALSIAPAITFVDISHGITPQDVEMGAWILGVSWRYFPVGAALLCVVDPGVGGERRAVALEAHGRFFIGPDNGLFTDPLEDVAADDFPMRCVNLDNPRYHLPAPSATFHGRDIFAPSAAHFLAGVPFAALGSAVEVSTLLRLDIARRAEWRGEILVGRVAHVDHYGNLITTIGPEEASQALGDARSWLSLAGREVRERATYFAAGPIDAPFILQDSSGALAVAIRGGSAAQTLGARRGDIVTLHGLTRREDAARRKRRR